MVQMFGPCELRIYVEMLSGNEEQGASFLLHSLLLSNDDGWGIWALGENTIYILHSWGRRPFARAWMDDFSVGSTEKRYR